MSERRPDPETLLRQIQASEPSKQGGRLKVFLGASAGVGKTFAMLSEAHEQLRRGVDVVLGAIETHGRAETEALLAGLERVPLRSLEYRGVALQELDVDAVLIRSPDLVVIDELAHTNVPGSRHSKRWQDVIEVLAAGIDVYTAVNIQHLESLNDAVAQITGIAVKETVPDSLVERADEIEVVDVPPEELRQRLREGKVYVPEQIGHALEGFFRPSNLLALRELALRRAADRVDAQMRALRTSHGDEAVWPARERIVACIAPSPMASRVVRAAARISATSHAETHALYIESDRQSNRPASHQQQAYEALRLAESLGMRSTTLAAHDIVGEILMFARQQNATLIVLGKPVRARWRELLFGSVVDDLVRRSGEIDVYVVTEAESPQVPSTPLSHVRTSASRLAQTVGIVAACAAAGLGLDHLGASDANLVMVLLLGVALVAYRYGVIEAVAATILGVACFNFLFVDPIYSFAVSDTQYLLTFTVMLSVALLISTLTLRLRAIATASAERERRSASLYTFSRAVARARTKEEIAEEAQREIQAQFAGEVAVFEYSDPDLLPLVGSASRFEWSASEQAVAVWAFMHAQNAGRDTNTLSGADGLYIPLVGGQKPVGVMAFSPDPATWPLDPARRNLLEAFANTLGLALERAQLAKDSQEARLAAESERLRNALLSSISHDLRTPLTAISGAASALVAQGGGELAETIEMESRRLNHQVQNLLDMTRIQSGSIAPSTQWHVVEEMVGSALDACRPLLQDHPVTVELAPNLPLLHVDGELIVKLLVNLLENVAFHTPSGSAVRVTAYAGPSHLELVVADRGPGLPVGQEEAVFERFAQGGRSGQGLGLGLAICRAIAQLHGGRIWAQNRADGGAEFHLVLPLREDPPEVPIG